jgi:V/A-type H+-transporting ATPase subunit E
MSIENIIGKILAEAENESQRVLEEAGEKSRDILEKAEAQAEKIRKDSEVQAKEDASLLKSRRTSVAELEVRKMRLGAKQALISRCFDAALDQLANMEEAEYLEFLTSAILATGADGGELLLNARDRKAIGEKLVKKINGTGKAGTLTLAEDTIDAKGGFVLRKGSVEMNSTLETMVNGIRESATPDVVKALFG